MIKNKEIERLKKLEKEILELRNKITKYFTYNSLQIGNIIAKLMTSFEGIDYQCSKNFFFDSQYDIELKSNNIENSCIYNSFEIKNIKKNSNSTYLPPSNFNFDNTIDYSYYVDTNNTYIKLFIDYLYEQRISNSLEEIREDQLEKLLQDFLEKTIFLQQQRKKEIEEKITKEEFEKSCLIDRKLIFNLLIYIINNYEDNINASQEKYEEWSINNDLCRLIAYHRLTINYLENEISFKVETNSHECYHDEMNCILSIDLNKDGDICFFDLKRKLLPVLNNSIYLNDFMNMIEDEYNNCNKISIDKLQEFLILLKNN